MSEKDDDKLFTNKVPAQEDFKNPPLTKDLQASEKMKSPKKVVLGSLEDPDLVVEAQFNPKELEISQNVPWNKPQEANKSNARRGTQAKATSATSTSGINLEFGGTEGRTLTLDLMFDNFERDMTGSRQVDVAKMVTRLQAMASVKTTGATQEADKRPHRCLLVWGEVLPAFKCVIASLSVKYLMFSADGIPLRAQCTVKLMEADFVSAKTKGK